MDEFRFIRAFNIGGRTGFLRLLDILVIGPYMLYVGSKQKNRYFKAGLMIGGAATMLYNARQYMLERQALGSQAYYSPGDTPINQAGQVIDDFINSMSGAGARQPAGVETVINPAPGEHRQEPKPIDEITLNDLFPDYDFDAGGRDDSDL